MRREAGGRVWRAIRLWADGRRKASGPFAGGSAWRRGIAFPPPVIPSTVRLSVPPPRTAFTPARPARPGDAHAPSARPPALAPRLPADRRARPGRPHAPAIAPRRGRGRHPLLDEVGDPRLPRRRPAAPGHVRPQAGRAQGVRRPLEAGRHQRARHPNLRSAAAARQDHGQARDRPLARRQPGRARRRAGVQRPAPRQALGRRPVPAVRLGGGEAARPGRPGRAAVREPLLPLHARAVQRARPRLPRPRPRPVPPHRPGPRRHDPPRRHRRSPRRPQGAAPRLRRLPPRGRRERGREGDGRVHRTGVRAFDLVAPGRGARPVQGRPEGGGALRHGRPDECSWTTTAPRGCRRAC